MGSKVSSFRSPRSEVQFSRLVPPIVVFPRRQNGVQTWPISMSVKPLVN
jgi:hypothetical protein